MKSLSGDDCGALISANQRIHISSLISNEIITVTAESQTV